MLAARCGPWRLLRQRCAWPGPRVLCLQGSSTCRMGLPLASVPLGPLLSMMSCPAPATGGGHSRRGQECEATSRGRRGKPPVPRPQRWGCLPHSEVPPLVTRMAGSASLPEGPRGPCLAAAAHGPLAPPAPRPALAGCAAPPTFRHAHHAVVLARHDAGHKVAQLLQVKPDLGDEARVHHACGGGGGGRGGRGVGAIGAARASFGARRPCGPALLWGGACSC